jgi:hypothetical protein
MRPTTALTELICLRPKGKRVAVTVAIGHPYPSSEGPWGCPVSITGLHKGVATIYGLDSLQALSLAIAFVRARLTSFVADGGRILISSSGEEFPLDAYFGYAMTKEKRRPVRPAPRRARRRR